MLVRCRPIQSAGMQTFEEYGEALIHHEHFAVKRAAHTSRCTPEAAVFICKTHEVSLSEICVAKEAEDLYSPVLLR